MAEPTDLPAPTGQPPGRSTPTAPAGDPNRPRVVYRDADGHLWRALLPRDLATALRQGDGQLWVDIDSTNRHQHALLEKVFKFHPLAIEDTLNPQSRVKVEDYQGQYLFVVLRTVRFCEETTDNPYDLETINLCLFIGPNYLVTVHAEPAPSVDSVTELINRNPDLVTRGPGRLAHMVIDGAIDAYFPILDKIDEFVDGLEQRVFATFDDTALQDIFHVRRLVLSLRRYLTPQREVLNLLTNRPTPLLTSDTQLYFRDVYDHVLRINDSLDSYRELLSGTLDSYLSQVSNRLGLVTKGLSVVATLSIPFVVISGMWGMNFEHIPLSGQHHGFALMMVLQLVLGVLLVMLLRWWKLL
jgi:magnesium transporter